ncbi:SDR family NAD(P)-dependent oxidoreductase [Rhizobium puerariae]|uniref:SDR family NAD(P)-dependent oxidoreductase n=1 Tax=Rhizobium puerariae TaxID=1585791 RepID=A0ABV6AE13_9HYPH
MNSPDHKTVLITGSTDGVGRRVAQILGRAGHTVLVHGRDAQRAETTAKEIVAAGGTAHVYLADFSSLAEVRSFADAVSRDHPRIDVLINNAGIGFGRPGGQREVSRDGHELRFAVNYLAPFLLTRLLLPTLARRGSRIVNVASIGQQPIDFADIMLTRRWDGQRAYRQSKLALIMFSFDLADELRTAGVTVNALHPATFMATTMVEESGIAPWSTIDEGAEAILQPAVSAELEGRTDLYFEGKRPAKANAQAYDVEARSRLHALSVELAGLAPADAQSKSASHQPSTPNGDISAQR